MQLWNVKNYLKMPLVNLFKTNQENDTFSKQNGVNNDALYLFNIFLLEV